MQTYDKDMFIELDLSSYTGGIGRLKRRHQVIRMRIMLLILSPQNLRNEADNSLWIARAEAFEVHDRDDSCRMRTIPT